MLLWSDSADKHGIAHEDAVHAMANAHLVVPDFEESRVPGGRGPTLFLGPPRQLGGPLLEVMVELVPPRTLRVFHVMIARPKFLARLEETE